jgi:adenine-specific DNA-methyltransferase
VPVLPLQRNEIVSDSRIAQIIERARLTADAKSGTARQGHLFADLEKTLREGDRSKRVEFYTHEEGWKNKLICGDSLHVMESVLHYENLRGKVQMIYIDPPYGIKYNSNFQQRVDSTKNDENDAADDVLTIKAFRDTWSLGIHSYLSYLQERLYLCRELMREEGSVFVQISDDNVHLVRTAMDEVFGANNFISLITFKKTAHAASTLLPTVSDYLVWYARDKDQVKYLPVYVGKRRVGEEETGWDMVESPDGRSRRKMTTEELLDHDRIPDGWRVIGHDNLTATGYSEGTSQPYVFEGRTFKPSVTGATERHWKVKPEGLDRLVAKNRLMVVGNSLRQKRYLNDFPHSPTTNLWEDTVVSGFAEPRIFVVQTNPKVVERCIFMTTSPGDLVLDPTW